MEYVIVENIRVSNNSWGNSIFSQAMYDVIEASQAIGHVFVASAGNNSLNTDDHPHYPSGYDLPNIIAVAATDNDDNLGVFPSGATSNYGPVTVDLGAPGINVYSTVLESGYDYANGTSMAAPHVTGVVALIMSRNPSWSWQQVRDRVLTGVRPVDSLLGITATGGVVDAAIVGDCNGNGVPDEVDIADGTSEDCTGDGVPDECDPDCNGNGVADSCDVGAGTSGDCNANWILDECDIAAERSTDCNLNDLPDECELADGSSADCNINDLPDECDIQSGDWADLDGNGVLDACEVPILYVRADGGGADYGTSWDNAFHDLRDALTIAAGPQHLVTEIWVAEGTYTPTGPGGDRLATFRLASGVGVYGGFAGGETERGQRDPVANPTVLSGDSNGDDGPHPLNREENSYQVVTADLVDETAVLDGFTITGGQADHPEDRFHRHGAGLYSRTASPTVVNCVFQDNHAGSGGGMHSGTGSPTLRNCRFVANSAEYGGGLSGDGSNLTVESCAFSGNSAYIAGGIAFFGPRLTLINCTVNGNTGLAGAGLRVNSSEDSLTTVTNCIVWGNAGNGTTEQQQIYNLNDEGTPTVSYSCIQGLDVYVGNGNTGDDPQFVDEGVHLAPDSPCVNAGDPTFVPDPSATDIDGEARVMDGRVEMGADEIALDCNGNGIHDEMDIAEGTSEDCNGNIIPDECDLAEGSSEDCQPNGLLDECDIAIGASLDCQLDGIPDECEIATGMSEDANGNEIPDECERPPAPEPGGLECATSGDCTGAYEGADCVTHDSATGAGTCYVPKNRYLSIDPTTSEGPVAYRIEITAAVDYPTAVGRTWWIDEPACYDYPNGDPVIPAPPTCGGLDRFGWVSRVTATPVSRIWSEVPLHVTGCGIVPAVLYEIRASGNGGADFSEPLEINTAHQPEGEAQSWGDVTGGPVPGMPGLWLPPERATNFGDVGNAIRTFENRTDDTGFPPHIWVDVEINQVINLGDIQFIINAFEGKTYADLNLPLIGVHPVGCP